MVTFRCVYDNHSLFNIGDYTNHYEFYTEKNKKNNTGYVEFNIQSIIDSIKKSGKQVFDEEVNSGHTKFNFKSNKRTLELKAECITLEDNKKIYLNFWSDSNDQYINLKADNEFETIEDTLDRHTIYRKRDGLLISLHGEKITDQKKDNLMNHVCLSINPNIYIDNTSKWMEMLAIKHPERQLKDIFIPGTHDSGTYGITEPRTWSLINGVIGHYLAGPDYANPELEELGKNKILKLAPDVVRALAKAQEKRVSEQLKDGIRFLDIRPCKRNENDFWISHSIYSVPLDEVLDDISDFLKENTEELIIIDFRFVFGLSGDRERLSERLWKKVNEKLKNNIISVENPENMASLTLGDISKQNEEGSVILLWDINTDNKHGISEKFAKCGLDTRKWADIIGEGSEYDSVDKLRNRISEQISERSRKILKDNQYKMCLVKCEPDEEVMDHILDSVIANMVRTILPSWLKDAGLRLKASDYNPAMKKEIEKSWDKKLKGGYVYTFDFYNIPENLAKTIIKLNYAHRVTSTVSTSDGVEIDL